MYSAQSLTNDPNVPVLILIHGAGSSHLGWHSKIRRMSGMDVYALDLPGHGRSEGPALSSIQDYASAIDSFLTDIVNKSVFIAGHSLGGLIGLQLALTTRKRLSGLIMVCSSARHPIPAEIALKILNPEQFHEAFDWLIHHLGNPQQDPKWVEQTRLAVGSIPREVLNGDILAGQGVDLTEKAGGLQIPVLICSAENDRFFGPEVGKDLAAQIPKGEYICIPDAGHLMPLEKPELTEKIIRGFIEKNLADEK